MLVSLPNSHIFMKKVGPKHEAEAPGCECYIRLPLGSCGSPDRTYGHHVGHQHGEGEHGEPENVEQRQRHERRRRVQRVASRHKRDKRRNDHLAKSQRHGVREGALGAVAVKTQPRGVHLRSNDQLSFNHNVDKNPCSKSRIHHLLVGMT